MYDPYYELGEDGSYVLNPSLMDRRYSKYKNKIITNDITHDNLIVDLGCGGGWGLIPFHDNNYNYYGFDFNDEYLEYGQSKGLRLFKGGI
jgi:2-polyprenyl-3-methyl-5-hydroxy-6-metoxy-1,4-benzoquinol methylase